MKYNICVFASSSNVLDKSFYDDAEELGVLIGDAGFNIVYGGSRLGLMYKCALSVKLHGGKIIGIMPEKLNNLGFGNPDDCEEFYITDGMRERKAKMDEISDAVIALPGGFGTLEEISEMIVQKQLGYNNKPIVLLNTCGFYDNLIKFFDTVMARKFAKNGSENMYFIANTPKEAVEYIKLYNPKIKQPAGKF